MMRLLSIFFIISSIACSTSRQLTPSRVGLVNLPHFTVSKQASVPDDTSYLVFTNPESFHSVFMADTSAGYVVREPDFTGQQAVAVITRASAHASLSFSHAEITGNRLSVYLIPGADNVPVVPNHPFVAIATVPKSRSVRMVSFYVQGENVTTVHL